jgi:hypothetical protein
MYKAWYELGLKCKLIYALSWRGWNRKSTR